MPFDGRRPLERRSEAIKGGGAHCSQNFVLVPKIAVRRHGANIEFSRQFPHRHRLRPTLGEKPFGDGAKPLAKGFDLATRKVAWHSIQCKFTL